MNAAFVMADLFRPSMSFLPRRSTDVDARDI
jgi:hypothetical protein